MTDLIERMAELESKGLIRRVRTPEGVRKFGQPIGSVIIRDAINVNPKKRYRRASTASKLRRRSKEKTRTGSWANPEPPKRKYPQEIAWRPPTELGIVRGSASDHDVTIYPKSVVDDKWQVVIYEAGRSESKATFWLPGDNIDEVKASAQKTYSDWEAKQPKMKIKPKRTPREVESFWDAYEGIYGLDWQNEGDDIDLDKFDNDPLYREFLAHSESADIGVGVMTFARRSGSKGDLRMDPNVHEGINALARVYEEWYPGLITDHIPNFRIESEGSSMGAIAFNQHLAPSHATIIGLAENYFAEEDGNRDPLKHLEFVKRESMASGWHSPEGVEVIAKEMGVEPWQVAMYATIHHEVGHTINRMIFGEMSAQGIDQLWYREEYAERVGAIFVKYGIFEDEGDNGFDAMMRQESHDIFTAGNAGKSPYSVWSQTVNKTALRAHLSEYGSSSLHEFGAEVWSSYVVDPRPTEFVQEVGEVMEEMMTLWMEENREARGIA